MANFIFHHTCSIFNRKSRCSKMKYQQSQTFKLEPLKLCYNFFFFSNVVIIPLNQNRNQCNFGI